MDRITAMRRTRLAGDDAERFFAALDRKDLPNEAMRKLMADHADRLDADRLDADRLDADRWDDGA